MTNEPKPTLLGLSEALFVFKQSLKKMTEQIDVALNGINVLMHQQDEPFPFDDNNEMDQRLERAATNAVSYKEEVEGSVRSYDTIKIRRPKANLYIFPGDVEVWLPHSQISINESKNEVTMPEWLVVKNGL